MSTMFLAPYDRAAAHDLVDEVSDLVGHIPKEIAEILHQVLDSDSPVAMHVYFALQEIKA